MLLATELPAIELICIILVALLNTTPSHIQYSSDIMDYTMFLLETELSICLLCVFVCVHYLPWSVFDTTSILKTR